MQPLRNASTHRAVKIRKSQPISRSQEVHGYFATTCDSLLLDPSAHSGQNLIIAKCWAKKGDRICGSQMLLLPTKERHLAQLPPPLAEESAPTCPVKAFAELSSQACDQLPLDSGRPSGS